MQNDTAQVQFLSPDGMHKNPAFSQAVLVSGNARTLYIGGQDAVDKEGNIVGKGDIGAQTAQVLENIQIALTAGGATIHHVIKWTLYVVKGQPLEKGFEVFQKTFKDLKNPPIISMAFVEALANPDYLLEMDAIAVIPG